MEKPKRPEWFPEDLYNRIDSFETGWFHECIIVLGDIYQSNSKAAEEIPEFVNELDKYYHSKKD